MPALSRSGFVSRYRRARRQDAATNAKPTSNRRIARLRDEFEEIKINAEIQRPSETFLLDLHEDQEGPRLLDDLRSDGGSHHRRFASRIVTPRSASCTRSGSRCRGASKITSRCPSPTCTSRCTRRSSARAAIRSRFRSARWEMHRTSEYGIAAHWRYKEGGKADQFENKLSWLRSLLEWQNDMRDSRVFMENLKLDLFDSQVFVFSPRGDVFSIAAGGDAARFRLSGPYRRRQSLRRREGQRQDRSARLPAAERRHLRDSRQ